MSRLSSAVVLLSIVWMQDVGRSQDSDSSVVKLPVQWQVPTINDPQAEDAVKELADKLTRDKVPAIPRLQPLVAGDFVFMRTPQEVMGVGFRVGKRIWEYPWHESLPRLDFGVTEPRTATHTELLSQRLWNDTVYASLSSDGENLFVLDKLSFVIPSGRVERMEIGPGGLRVVNLGELTANWLVSLSIPTDGKIHWIVGGETGGGDEPELANFFLLSSGTPHDGRLYVVGEKERSLQLLALAPETGRLEWSVELRKLEEAETVSYSPMRRLAGVTPVVVGKRVICPMALGRIAAVDVEKRAIAWTRSYEIEETARLGLRPASLPKQGKRWLDNAALPAGENVIVTPVDSQFVYCLDAATGEVKWRQERGDRLFAAVNDDVCLLIGPTSVLAVNPSNGEWLWHNRRIEHTPEGAMVTGRGAFQGDRYLLAVGKRLLAIDSKSGEVSVVANSEHEFGNLAIHEDTLISQTIEGVSKYLLLTSD